MNSIKKIEVPVGVVDVVLDTDAYNEIDDQFAIAYMLKSNERINTVGICAAPFFNTRSSSPKDGMKKSYSEIIKLLDLLNMPEFKQRVYKGSTDYLPDETTPAESDAADFMANLANKYTKEKPLYIVAIGAITNVASALLKNPKMVGNSVIVWLGGHANHYPMPVAEFNMRQDIAAARVVMGSGVRFVQLPCCGVVDGFYSSKYELEHWLLGRNPLCDYLCKNTIEYMSNGCPENYPWSKVIWDVTAVAWLLNDNERFMLQRYVKTPLPRYDKGYELDENNEILQVYSIKRDPLFNDLINKLYR